MDQEKLPTSIHTVLDTNKGIHTMPHLVQFHPPNLPTMLETQSSFVSSLSSPQIEHKRIEEDRPFHCTACQKKFRQLVHLQQHIRIHTNERPYPCAHCDKRFKQRSQVNQHERIHTGEKPYQCNICLKNYAQAGQVYSHKRSVHGIDPKVKNKTPSDITKLEPKPKKARKSKKQRKILAEQEIQSMISEIKREDGPLPPVYVCVVNPINGKPLYETCYMTTPPPQSSHKPPQAHTAETNN